MRRIKRTRTTQRGWAIETGVAEKPFAIGLLDRGFSLFGTRKRARNRMQIAKESDLLPRKARVVRVSVTVTTIGRG
jgi:hypothetical protein